MQAIILLGGFGTRLQAVVPNTPKPMAEINQKPFLAYLLDHLALQGVTSVVFSVHYLWEKIAAYFASNYRGIRITYAIEETPLGTGGAIKHAISYLEQAESFFVLNGDTYLKLDYQAMLSQAQQKQRVFAMALRSVEDCTRYGKVIMNDTNTVRAFKEKGEWGAGLINAGVYLMQPDVFSTFNLPTIFSFETDFLFPHLSQINPLGFVTDDYFIDIGIPADYQKAQRELLHV